MIHEDEFQGFVRLSAGFFCLPVYFFSEGFLSHWESFFFELVMTETTTGS